MLSIPLFVLPHGQIADIECRLRTLLLLLGLVVCVSATGAQFQEPTGGLYPTNLFLFRDGVSKGVRVASWNLTHVLDTKLKKNGDAGWRWDVRPFSGMHLVWGGSANDTTAFWVHENSHISFWVRARDEKTTIAVLLGFMGGEYEVLPQTVIPSVGEWRYMDLLVPTQSLRRPLNELKIMVNEIGGDSATLHLDDIKISNVRLYAGRGTAPSIGGLHADQIGYDIHGIKTFSAGKFSTFQIVGVDDNRPVYTGDNPRTVTSRFVNDSAVWIGDFTPLCTPGHYVIRLDNGITSYPFEVGSSVYDAPLRAAIRFFYYQRNNTAIEAPYAEGPWMHAKDSKEVVVLPGGKGTRLVRRGWHDAGDFSIYMPNHAYACFWLALAWEDFGYDSDDLNIPESGDGVPDLLNELRWGLDWIVDMQDTTDGAFYHNMCVQQTSPYKYGRSTPLTITGYELTNKTTAATAVGTGMLAYASAIFAKAGLDLRFAATMKRAALKGWKYLERQPGQINVTSGCATYQDPDDIHARFFAATALFYLTGEDQYHRYLLLNDPGSTGISNYNNQTNLAYLLYLKCANQNSVKHTQIGDLFARRAQEATDDLTKHPFGFIGYYYWGSLGTALARAGNYSILDWRANGNQTSLFTALQQLHYIFGQNSLGFVYLSGFGTRSMSNSFHHWLKTLDARPHNFPGVLAGGPNEKPDSGDMNFPNGYSRPPDTPIDSRYTDGDSWSTNEAAVNQNAQLIYVLAAAHYFAHGRMKPGTQQATDWQW